MPQFIHGVMCRLIFGYEIISPVLVNSSFVVFCVQYIWSNDTLHCATDVSGIIKSAVISGGNYGIFVESSFDTAVVSILRLWNVGNLCH